MLFFGVICLIILILNFRFCMSFSLMNLFFQGNKYFYGLNDVYPFPFRRVLVSPVKESWRFLPLIWRFFTFGPLNSWLRKIDEVVRSFGYDCVKFLTGCVDLYFHITLVFKTKTLSLSLSTSFYSLVTLLPSFPHFSFSSLFIFPNQRISSFSKFTLKKTNMR